MKTIVLDMENMTLDGLVAAAREAAVVRLSAEAEDRIRAGRALVDQWV